MLALMPGFALVKASTAWWVSLSRESLPQVETRRVVSPPESELLEAPGAHAGATSTQASAMAAVTVRRHPKEEVGGVPVGVWGESLDSGCGSVGMSAKPFSV